MNHSSRSVHFTLWLNRLLMGVVLALVLMMPRLIAWYNTLRILSDDQNYAILAAFYACVPVVLYALWNLEKLLRNIAAGQVFVTENVSFIGRVCFCCAGVGVICLPSAFFYAPLVFMCVIMGFLCPVVNVVRQVFRAAVDLREENDLTI